MYSFVTQNRGGLQQVPYWLWIILAYFMHDNIIEWIRNPFVLFVLLTLSGAGGYLIATGKWSQFVTVVQTLFIPVRLLLESKGILSKANAATTPSKEPAKAAEEPAN